MSDARQPQDAEESRSEPEGTAARPLAPAGASQGLLQRKISNRVAMSAILAVFLLVTALIWLIEGRRGDETEETSDDPNGWMYANRGMIMDSAAGSWGFNFSPSIIPPNEIVYGGIRKDNIPALVDPEFAPANKEEWIAPGERVVGVTAGGEARAYPLSILTRHECVNDTLGGEPIAVTYCGLSDSVMVFSRRCGGQVRTFGLTGLVYQSSGLLYDRQPDPHGESIWSQLMMRPVCGPAVTQNLHLELLDAEISTWAGWRLEHPATTALAADQGYLRNYGSSPYKAYYARNALMFPISRRSGRRPDLRNKAPLVILQLGKALRAYPLRDLAGAPRGILRDRLGDRDIEIALDRASGSIHARLAGPDQGAAPTIRRAYALWFAWDALNPKADLYTPSKKPGPNR